MTPKSAVVVMVAVAAGFLAGCDTLRSRLIESEQFLAQYPPHVRAAVEQGRIDVGFDKELVRIAWGEPDEMVERRGPDGREEDWIYHGYRTRMSTEFVYAPAYPRYGRCRHLWGGSYVPVQTEYRELYPAAKVTFRGGKVARFEERRGVRR